MVSLGEYLVDHGLGDLLDGIRGVGNDFTACLGILALGLALLVNGVVVRHKGVGGLCDVEYMLTRNLRSFGNSVLVGELVNEVLVLASRVFEVFDQEDQHNDHDDDSDQGGSAVDEVVFVHHKEALLDNLCALDN